MRYQEILEACWTGYRQAGMKKKGDRQVPNCVPVEEVRTGPEITGRDLLFKAAAMAIRDASHEGVSLDYEQAIRQASKLYGIPYQPSELPRLLAQRAEIDRQLALLKQGKQVAKARRQEKRAPTPAGTDEYWRTHALPTDRIKPASKTLEAIEEDLKKWFKEKWVRFGPDGKIRGDCARGSEGEGKPKCLPQSKAHALGKKGRAASAAKKRREDPNPERRGPAKNVATRVKEQYTDDDDWYDDEDQDTELRSGDYVRDTMDGESGEVFRMQGDPYERRVRILDRDGRGWYIEPSRLTRVDSTDPDIQRYFGKKRVRDMDEAIVASGPSRPLDDRAIRKMVWDTMKINADTGEQALQRALAVLAKKPQSRMVQDLQDKFQNLADRLAQGVAEAISKKDLVARLQKDLPKVTDPKNKNAQPVAWTGPGKDDYGYTGYQGHGMPTDKQERDRIRADKKKGVAEGLLYSGDTWQDVLYRINVLNDIFGDQKDLAATFEPASQPEWGPFRDQILRSRTVLDTYAKVKQLANMNVPLTDVEIEMLDDVAWDGGGGPVEPAGHWGERDYNWLEDLYAQQFAVVQHLLDQRAQGHGQNKTKSGQTVHEQGVAEGWSDAVVARRTGGARTPYSVYIKGKKWKDFENDDLARAVA
jgi:hypothetical protein